jgi:hypothetical protein
MKEEFRKKWERWGWYSILHQIGEGGYFQKPGQTKAQSANEANFLEAMTWLAEKVEMGR